MKVFKTIYILIVALTIPFLASCTNAGNPNQAINAAENYLQALVKKDANHMINLSCAAWEEQAKLEYDSFAAVELTLKDLSCQETGQEGEYTLVTCSGAIVASYGAEDLVLELAERPFKMVNEGGEWRMCGYR